LPILVNFVVRALGLHKIVILSGAPSRSFDSAPQAMCHA
jgi:hypothetical protein